jgi:hypothetical protein
MAMPPPPPPPFGVSGGCKPADRKTVERNRRNQMNALYYRLDTLVRDGSAPPVREHLSMRSRCNLIIHGNGYWDRLLADVVTVDGR